VLQKTFDKRNFRKKIISLGIVRETGRMQEGVKNRPAALYEFVAKMQQEISLFA
jgi:8-oxo-dGTP diphosphatase